MPGSPTLVSSPIHDAAILARSVGLGGQRRRRVPRGRGVSAQQVAAIQALDEVAQTLEICPVAVLKVDVEGAELEALNGAHGVLAEWRPFILCEVLPVYDEAGPQGRFRKLRQMRLESIETHGKLEWSDYLFYPKETQAALEAGPLGP